MIPRSQAYFPQQKVDGATKRKPEWYANCIDYIIDAGLSFNDRQDTETKLNILHGNIPDEFYKKTINPYNSSKERYTRFPATMRNLDIMNDIVRRYVSEYFKGVHEFVVSANNPDIVLNKNARLKEQVMLLAQQALQQSFEQAQAQMQAQAEQGGQPQGNPQDAMPDPEQFIKDFNDKYIDDESKQAQDVLDFVRANTKDNLIYLSAFFNFVTLGECYTYCDIRGSNIFKENVPVIEAYPIPNDNFYVEDHDMFARRMTLSYQQIMDMFDDTLTKEDRKLLEEYYSKSSTSSQVVRLSYNQYFETHKDICSKFNKEERKLFKDNPIKISDGNNNLYEVWHVVWRGEAKRGVLTRINEIGFPVTEIVDETYTFNKEAGDVNIEWTYEPQVYEGYRIGNRYTAIYPIKARPISYNRNGKLPYNGIMEVLPMMGKFSIIQTITPYQIMRNIISYHREMVIAKNKMLILMIPESLIASDTEDKIYKMAADGVLIVDDSEDANSQRMANVRLLNANLGNYISELTNLMEAIKLEAREMVDMNMQRYGDIAQSAGAATTQEAITRSSMGMVILVEMFDSFRRTDYNRDLDYCKLAYVDGLDTSYYNEVGQKNYISLDVNSFINSDYSTTVKNDAKELDRIQQLRQWAFSAAQNGDLDMALAAITGNNTSQIKASVEKFMEIKRKHEQDMQQAEQMIKQEEIENKLKEIQAKGEEDRKTEELKYQYELQLKYVDVDMSLMSAPDVAGTDDNEARARLAELAESNKQRIAQDKMNLERQKMMSDTYNKAADRAVKMKDIESKERIARINKNRYDK